MTLPTAILTIQPSSIEIPKIYTWKTLISEFENGLEQRRSVWDYSKVSIKAEFDFHCDQGTRDRFADFFLARKGAVEPFLIPSWDNDARTTSAATYARNLGVNTVTRFALTSTIGNIVIIGKLDTVNNWAWTMEARQITSISVGNTLTFATSLQGYYPAGSFIYIGHIVRLASEEILRNVIAGKIHTSDSTAVEFKGVRL